MEILLLEPTTLNIHPALAAVPMLHEVAEHFGATQIHHHDKGRREAGEAAAEDWQAFRQDVAARGVQDPLKVIRGPEGWQVVDGRHRLKASEEAGLETVPCVETTEAEITNVIAANILARRHVTKTARAWLAVTLFPQVLESKVGGDQKSAEKKSLRQIRNDFSQTSLAQRFGVSQDTMSRVCKVYEAARKLSAFASFEWNVWRGLGVAELEKQLGMAETQENHPERVSKEPSWGSTLRALGSFNERMATFDKWPEEEQKYFSDTLGHRWARLGTPQINALQTALNLAKNLPNEKKQPASQKNLLPLAPPLPTQPKAEGSDRAPHGAGALPGTGVDSDEGDHEGEVFGVADGADRGGAGTAGDDNQRSLPADGAECGPLPEDSAPVEGRSSLGICAGLHQESQMAGGALVSTSKLPKTEPLYTCPCCQSHGWKRRELKERHRCPAKDGEYLSKGDLLAAMPDTQ